MLRGRFPGSRSIGAAVLFAAVGASAPARAGSFTDDGTFQFDPRAVARLGFEEAAPDDAGPGSAPDDHALEGGHVINVPKFQGIDLPVTLPQARATYRVSAWIRGAEATVSFELTYSQHKDEVAALYPTGRITSDGWVEVANDHLRVDGPRLKSASVGLFSSDGAVVDAVEIVPDGDATSLPAVPNAPCTGADDPSSCGVEQVCVWSSCRNVGGWVPAIPSDRANVTDYLENRLKFLFGPYLERTQDLPAVLVATDSMRHATDRYTFWNGFLTAVRKLHDGHTTTSGLADFVVQNPRPLAICFLEGDADLTHAAAAKDVDYLDVLVSHTGADHNLGLHPGDRLVRVDGQHPIAWMRALIDVNWSQPGISNHSTFAELSSTLQRMISRYAQTIQVIRCDAATSTCGAPETIEIGSLPEDAPGTPFDGVTCDNRPIRHLAGAPKNHATGDAVYSGLVMEANPGEKIYGLEWESLYTTNGSDGVAPDLHAAVSAWTADATGVILDHRTGFGGTILAPEILWNFSVLSHPNDLYVDRIFASEEQPDPAAAQARFQAALSGPLVQYAGSGSPNTDVPVALLLTEDVSASDWLPQGMKGSPSVRLFAPFQTNGGFSTRYAFGYWLGLGYIAAVGDDILPDGTTHNGRGVQPDQVVLPKQSDLLIGKDTVFEAGLSWVRAWKKP
ncbi:MAG: hypothetical protein ABJE95_19100 [Byssovorax sp.]